MPSLTARGIRRLARTLIKTKTGEPDQVVRHLRRIIERAPALSRMPSGVANRPLDPDELPGVAGEWVGVAAATRTLLHHHGGAYVSGRPATQRNLAGHLAHGLRANVLLAAYRLAPEHPHPAALQDGLANYRALIQRFDPSTVALTGDSAGGGLTLALLQHARDEGLPLPAGAVLLSPWADLTEEAPSRSTNDQADDMLSRATLKGAASAYLAGADPRQPSASPVLGDLAGLPPLLVTADESEILLDDATRIVEGAVAAGGQATLIRRSGLFHEWPTLVPSLPEACETVEEIVAFLDERLARS